MGGATLTTLADAFAKSFNGVVDTLDSTETPLMNALPAVASESNAFPFEVHYSGNSSTADYSENDAFPNAGNELYAEGTISTDNYKVTKYSITGHAIDALQGNRRWDAELANALGAAAQHAHARENALVTQLEAAIDSGGSYGGLLRSTYKLASYEAAAGGALAVSDLDTMYETLTAHPISIDPSRYVILSPVDTLGEYNDVAAGTGAANPLVMNNMEGETLDGGRFKFVHKYNGMPWITIPTMTSGGLLMADLSKVKRIVRRPMTMKPLSIVNDTMEFAITDSQTIVVLDTRRHGKITT